MNWREALNQALRRSLGADAKIPDDTVPVIMCSWRRPERLRAILADLEAQQGAPKIRLFVWNNHFMAHYGLQKQIRSFRRRFPRSRVEPVLIRSRENLGGIARFVVLRKLFEQGYRRSAILIDDDMKLGAGFVSTLVAAGSTETIQGVWAWKVRSHYWDRLSIKPGEPADYVGTGGAIVDPSIVENPQFFARLVPAYGAIEDVWMSRWATARGWKLSRIDAPHSFVEDDRAQYLGFVARKAEFWELVDRLVAGEDIEVRDDGTAGIGRVLPQETRGILRFALRKRLPRFTKKSRH
ncbi:hypothetical protein [Humidisolicoccus flavus]|uniref:hypothetical protein n=1 Tax=Humidisolicoccus flavus TaxID=3111414 RepID=UPI0032529C74